MESKKRFLKIVFLMTFAAVCYAQHSDGWIQQNSPATNDLYDVCFVDSNTGWAVGENGTVLKTNNGGDAWALQASGVSYHLHAVCFTNSENGWAVGANGTILHTTNGGNIWRLQAINTTSLLKSVFFIDDSLGWLCGDAFPSVYKTTNGGKYWFAPAESEYRSVSIFFMDQNVGWVAGPGASKTIDGGSTWTPCNVDINSHSIFFINENKGWIVGSPYDAYQTVDGGSTWSPMNIEFCLYLNDVFFVDENNGWTIGDGVHKTIDGGRSWHKILASSDFLATFFIDANIGWIVGNNGGILKTTTGGMTAVQDELSNKIDPSDFSLSQNYPNPFNPETTIRFSIPEKGHVSLILYDIQGREIRKLSDNFYQAGSHEIVMDASNLTSGIYFYILKYNSVETIRKMTVLK